MLFLTIALNGSKWRLFSEIEVHMCPPRFTAKTVAKMTAIKHALQRDIFTPNDERLLSIVNVCKAGKKKKNCFLCATGKGHVLLITFPVGLFCRLFKYMGHYVYT